MERILAILLIIFLISGCTEIATDNDDNYDIDDVIVQQVADILAEYGVNYRELDYPEFPELILELYESGILENYGGIYIEIQVIMIRFFRTLLSL